MENFHNIVINKNRGWRGLAEVLVRNEEYKTHMRMVFSFSEQVWTDLMASGALVVQDQDNYYILHITTSDRMHLPIGHQRSVLIKNYTARIDSVNKIQKDEWRTADSSDWYLIDHFRKNKNNHTTSDWNCIGISVTPII